MIKKIDLALRILPRPADYLWLYLIGFYALLLALRVSWKYAAVGALAFGFSTYLIIILGVGHNAKAHAIGYMPLVLAGIALIFRKKYWLGFVLTTLAFGLEIVANHLQMTYYLLLLILCMGISFLIAAYQKKVMTSFFKSVGVITAALLLGIGLNATSLLATKEYTQFSTRGKSEISINPDGSPKSSTKGLSKEYINQYSYGKLETLNLFSARIFGGSNDEPFDTSSAMADFLKRNQVPPSQLKNVYEQFRLYYWGDQPGVSGPAYIGALVIFLFILGLFLIKGRLKWWLVSGATLSVLLSYGSNLSWFTDLWIDYVPYYSKFRAVTSIQVITELCIPVLGILGLHQFIKGKASQEVKFNALKKATFISGGLAVVLLIARGIFDFAGGNDAMFIEQLGMDFINAVREDRKAIYTTDVLKSLVLVLMGALLLWRFSKQKLKENTVLLGIAILILADLVHIDRKYVNSENFVAASAMNAPFDPTPADTQILKDTTRFRVYEERVGIGTSRSSYFHNSIGGYHGAKPKRMQDIADFYLYQNKTSVLDWLNVKYIIKETEKGSFAELNPNAMGNAWFVNKVLPVASENEELLALEKFDARHTALMNKETIQQLPSQNFAVDTTATIVLKSEAPNALIYQSNTQTEQLAIFSEMYYPDGWNAYIDGNLVKHYSANYMLRALPIPKGQHEISFRFEPAVVSKGSFYSLLSFVIFLISAIGGYFFKIKNKRAQVNA